MHEILHFYYFKKWVQLFPKTKREELERPHLVWVLSEILDPVILNNHPEIKRLFNAKHRSYPVFYETNIGGISINEYYTNLWKTEFEKGTTFDEFIKLAWQDAQKHKNVLIRCANR